MSAFPNYDRYKDSGVDSFGEVPTGWDVQPICAVSKPKSVRGCPDRELLSVYLDRGVIKFSDVDEKRTNATSTDLSNYQAVDPGDLVLNNQQAWRGSVGVSTHEGIVSPAYIILSLSDRWNPAYANYLFRDSAMVSQYLIYSKGVGTIQRNLYYPDFKRASVILPPKTEQDRIVTFLDRKTAEIDALIAKKQRQIELIDEQKAILINRAVTRGLNPKAKLKPSGIEWIGDIPEGWEVRRYAHVARIVRGGSPRPAGHPAFFSSDGGTPWITVGEVTKDKGQYLTATREYLTTQGAKQSRFIEPGTLILTNSGATLGVPKVTSIGGCINDGVLAFLEIDEDRCLLDYLYNHLSTLTAFYRDRLRQGSGQPNLNTDLVKDTSVALPPTREEQRAICDFIKKVTLGAAETALAYERQIESLKTLRSTLIAHAVTGRIKVPE